MSLDWLRTFPQFIISHHGLTAFANFLANSTNKKIKNYLIKHFVTTYNINMSEALVEDPYAYTCFNDFFIRHLKPETRPLAKADIISPVDGFISEIGSIKDGQILQAKGHYYSVSELLACDKDIASQFINGHFATLYLSPKDYHRVHIPIQAELTSMTYIPGSLFSVKPSTVRVISKLFTRNERLIIFFSTPVGPMALVMVGAMIVGSIGTSWHGDIKRGKNRADFNYTQNSVKSIAQGDEIGYFKLGSTVVLLFSNQAHMRWKEHLKSGSRLLFGEALGELNILRMNGTEKRT